MTIQLPNTPKEDQYEDLIVATLLASGYYTESRLIMKDGENKTEILELDALATPVNDYTNRVIVEAKSGKSGTGHKELFKLYGQAMYTGTSRAWLVHLLEHDEPKAAAMQEVSDGIDGCEVRAIRVSLEQLKDDDHDDPFPLAIDSESSVRDLVLGTAWWGRIADRLVQTSLKHWIKSYGKEPPAEVGACKNYCDGVERSLFKKTPLGRADALYDQYKAHGKVYGNAAALLAGDKTEVFRAYTGTHKHLHVQHLMATQGRARLAIIKNAYDEILRRRAKTDGGSTDEFVFGNMTWAAFLEATFLPTNFQRGLKELDHFKHAERLAYFFQIFTEVLGGFYFPEDPGDMELVAAATGMPVEDIPTALDFMDRFFPLAQGASWFHSINGGIRILKGVPGYLRGTGCFYRQAAHGIKDYGEQYSYAAGFPLSAWHSALYKTLEPELKVDDEPA